MTQAASRIGVVGAGTMGSGIAQLAALSGARTLLHDPFPGAVEQGIARIERGLERGRYSEQEARDARERLSAAATLEDLAGCDLVIEAAPERIELKHELFAKLSEIVSTECVLATNTSSIPVTAIAIGASDPQRVVGMHFFNPAPVMKLVEVVAGIQSAEPALALTRATALAMGRTPIDAKDSTGFVVNRCNRPFQLEALRCVSEQIAPLETVDRIVRLGGGFRMGPFELSDLVGVDVGFEIQKSFYALSFGEPRWRPSPLMAQVVAAGHHGRKTGRGWYSYPAEGAHRPDDPPVPAPGAAAHAGEIVIVAGENTLAQELIEAAGEAGWDARTPHDAEGEVAFLILDCGYHDHDGPPLQGGPQLLLCDAAALSELDPEGDAVGFHALPPFSATKLVELTRRENFAAPAAERAEFLFASLGKHTEWVPRSAPGLVLGRIVCQLVNECAFALGEGIASAKDIDLGMTLGLNHPRGPLEWADAIGLDHVITVLEGLQSHYGEERYRPAPMLREMVLEGRLGRRTGRGFHSYD